LPHIGTRRAKLCDIGLERIHGGAILLYEEALSRPAGECLQS